MPVKVTVVQKAAGTYIIFPEGSIDSNTHTILRSEIEAAGDGAVDALSKQDKHRGDFIPLFCKLISIFAFDSN